MRHASRRSSVQQVSPRCPSSLCPRAPITGCVCRCPGPKWGPRCNLGTSNFLNGIWQRYGCVSVLVLSLHFLISHQLNAQVHANVLHGVRPKSRCVLLTLMQRNNMVLWD